MASVCDGLRVFDLGQTLATSLVGMLLADNGAEVIRLEPPAGDPGRSEPAWILWHRGKKSIVLDLDRDGDRLKARDLGGQVDILIEDRTTGTLHDLGLGYEALSQSNPGLVYCSITAFGSRGVDRHLPAYEGLVQAQGGGYLSLSTWMGRQAPTYRARPDASFAAANMAIQAIMGALRVRHLCGRGQHIETSLYRGMTAYEAGSFESDQKRLGLIPGEYRETPGFGPHLLLNYLVARTSDGRWIQMTNNTARLFPLLLKSLGLSHVYQDPRFKGAPLSFPDDKDRLALRRMILEKVAEKPLAHWMEVFLRDGLAGDLFMSTQEFMDHPQTACNEGVVSIEDPVRGPSLQIGSIVRFERTRSIISKPAPARGQDSESILAGPRRAAPNRPAITDHPPAAPFSGMLVLDFAGWLAAPFGTSLIADLGARVIKVEALQGDEFRSRGQARGRSFQGKESLCIDLKHPAGRKWIHKLIARTDAIVHNMRGDAASRLGIDLDTVRGITPDIIYHYAGSYGSTGPGAGRAAFHPTAGAMTGGALWQLGNGNQPPPADEPLSLDEIDAWSLKLLRANEGSPDVTAALAVGSALAMALYHKARTGVGQALETSMLISNAYTCSDDFLRYPGKPPRREPDRYLRGINALCRLYQSADGWMFVECRSDAEWRDFAVALGRPSLLDDARFRDGEGRLAHDASLIAEIAVALRARTSGTWQGIMRKARVPCVPVGLKSPGEYFLTDDSVLANEMVVRTVHPATGTFFRQGPPARLTLTPGRADPAHRLGEDTSAILSEVGATSAEIDQLQREGVIKVV